MKRFSLLLLSLIALQGNAFSEDEFEHQYDFIPVQELKTIHHTFMDHPEVFLIPYFNEEQIKLLNRFLVSPNPVFNPPTYTFEFVERPWYAPKPKPKPKNTKLLDFCKRTVGIKSLKQAEIWYFFDRNEWNNSSVEVREAAMFHKIASETEAEPVETCALTQKFKNDRSQAWAKAQASTLVCEIQITGDSSIQGTLKEGETLKLSVRKGLDFIFSFNANQNEKGILFQEQNPEKPKSKSRDRLVLISPYAWIGPEYADNYQFKAYSGDLVKVNCSLEKK